MSQLDALDADNPYGVPMQDKPKLTLADHIGNLTSALTLSHERLAQTVSDALTSQRSPIPSTGPSPRACSFKFTRGPDGKIETGTVSNGASTWQLSINRVGNNLSIDATPE